MIVIAHTMQSISLFQNPGPADYTIGSPDLYLDASPKYTMGITLQELKKNDFPGPLNYKSEQVSNRENYSEILLHIHRCCCTEYCIFILVYTAFYEVGKMVFYPIFKIFEKLDSINHVMSV